MSSVLGIMIRRNNSKSEWKCLVSLHVKGFAREKVLEHSGVEIWGSFAWQVIEAIEVHS